MVIFFKKKEENQSRSCNISISPKKKKKKIATYQYQRENINFHFINFPLKKININFHFIVFYNQISTLQTYYFLTKRTLIMLPDMFLYILFQGNKQILVNPSIKLPRLVHWMWITTKMIIFITGNKICCNRTNKHIN